MAHTFKGSPERKGMNNEGFPINSSFTFVHSSHYFHSLELYSSIPSHMGIFKGAITDDYIDVHTYRI